MEDKVVTFLRFTKTRTIVLVVLVAAGGYELAALLVGSTSAFLLSCIVDMPVQAQYGLEKLCRVFFGAAGAYFALKWTELWQCYDHDWWNG